MRNGRALLDQMARGLGHHGGDATLAGAPEPRPASSRYRVREDPDGRVLVCTEAPTLRVRIDRGSSVTPAAARSAPPGTIFVDGAAQGEPFVDPQRAVYNLDHHEGCVRAFTLAACEQAMVLIRKGLDLRRRDFTIVANDVDLDALLAVWVLLNHLRLAGEDPRARAAVMPLLRLEGAIDAHGLDLVDLAALPTDLLQETRRRMDRLLGREQALKSSGLWPRIDPLEYAADRLATLDALVYPPDHFEDVAEIEELARFDLCEGSVGVACRAKVGIYEVEQQLRRFHGDRLGLIVLQKGESEYSLRQVDPTLRVGLPELYQMLNLVDPRSGGSLAPNRWGGSNEIGGSPRATGTGLDLERVAEVCRQAYQRVSFWGRLFSVGGAALGSVAALAISLAAILAARSLEREIGPLARVPSLWFGASLGLFCACFLALVGRRNPGIFGLRRPAGRAAWWLLGPAAIGAVAGGVWVPAVDLPGAGPPGIAWLALLGFALLPIGAEILFRGLVHGVLAGAFPIQRAGGPWFVSWPALVCGALYAPWVVVLAAASVTVLPSAAFPWNAPVWGSVVFGVACALARERSESLVLPVLFHALCVPLALFVPRLLA
jgi:hypothetical protein